MKKIKYILLIITIATTALQSFSQGTTVYSGKKNIYLGLSLSGGLSTINHTVSTKNEYSDAGGLATEESFNIGYSISRIIGIETGVGFQSFTNKASLKEYTNNIESIDNEGDAFEMEISGNTITDQQTLGLLQIPVSVRIQIPLSTKFFLIVQPGVVAGFPLIKTSSVTSTFTYNGYYPEYNVTLTDLPQYGFASDYETTIENEMATSSLVFLLQARAGLSYMLSPKLNLTAGVCYDKNLSTLLETTPDAYLTTAMDNVKSSSVLSTQSDLSGISGFVTLGMFLFR